MFFFSVCLLLRLSWFYQFCSNKGELADIILSGTIQKVSIVTIVARKPGNTSYFLLAPIHNVTCKSLLLHNLLHNKEQQID